MTLLTDSYKCFDFHRCVHILKRSYNTFRTQIIHRSFQMQCELDVSVISGRPEVHPIISLWYFFLNKFTPLDFKFYLVK